jgi:transposase
MRTRAARIELSATEQVLLVSLELSSSTWKLVFGNRLSGERRRVDVKAWDQAGFAAQLSRARRKLGLPEGCRVISCQEAGRDGFAVHRFLLGVGIESLVIDAASVSVPRKQRRAKTDRLDADKLMDHLSHYCGGDWSVWRVLYVPSEESEDRRRLHRELEVLKAERTRIRCRIQSMLATVGIRCRIGKDWDETRGQLRQWDGSALKPGLLLSLGLESKRLQHVEGSIRELKTERQRLVTQGQEPDLRMVQALAMLRALGEETSWYLVMECFGFRRFDNQRQVGACAGLAPTPYDSGQSRREQGIGKDGNRRLRWILIELAWGWLRLQPDSALSRWFRQRFGGDGKRHRRVGIVALARKLLVALWRYVDQGIVPEGAVLKATA